MTKKKYLSSLSFIHFLSLFHHLLSVSKGVIQATSAYFSFKVLPNLADAGYYSDKAVLSRFFVFENLYFQLMALFGSIYYNDALRSRMQSSLLGKGLEVLFVFFPYVIIRPWFPTTRFSDAGTSNSGRSKVNERFYKIGTLMVKFFYVRLLCLRY